MILADPDWSIMRAIAVFRAIVLVGLYAAAPSVFDVSSALTAQAPAVVRSYSPFNPFLIPPAFYPVVGNPFTAEIRVAWSGCGRMAAGVAVGRVVWDAEGRERFEFPMSELDYDTGAEPSVTIYDLVGGQIVKLNPGTRVATVLPMTHVGPKVDGTPRVESPVVPSGQKVAGLGESLGSLVVAGIETRGWRVIRDKAQPDGSVAHTVRDLWLSTRYRIPLREQYDDSVYGRVVETVTKFDATEPDPGLFEVPAGYSQVAAQ
jgi:hypothetical protein